MAAVRRRPSGLPGYLFLGSPICVQLPPSPHVGLFKSGTFPSWRQHVGHLRCAGPFRPGRPTHVLLPPSLSVQATSYASYRQFPSPKPCTRSPQGINSLPVAANSATGFGDPDKLGAAAPHTIAGAFFVPAASCHGGCARETFGSAGFQVPGSPTCVQLPPIVWRQCVVVPT